MSTCEHYDGPAGLAAEILRRAVEDWRANRRPFIAAHDGKSGDHADWNACTGHSWVCRCRACAEDWFAHETLPGHISFRLACDAVGIAPDVILSRLRRG
jgi:hypothetical protein